MADSTGRFPLASGVEDAICDFKLDGMELLAVIEIARAGEGFGVNGTSGSRGCSPAETDAAG